MKQWDPQRPRPRSSSDSDFETNLRSNYEINPNSISTYKNVRPMKRYSEIPATLTSGSSKISSASGLNNSNYQASTTLSALDTVDSSLSPTISLAPEYDAPTYERSFR